MKNSYWMILAAIVVIMTVGCHFWIEVPVETTVRAQNEMTDLEVSVYGETTSGVDIDLNGVTIGDVYFSKIPAGSVTGEEDTDRSGIVNVFIASADAITYTFGIETVYPFEDIDPMETDIEEGEDNTVIFDEETAGVVFSALAKRRDQK